MRNKFQNCLMGIYVMCTFSASAQTTPNADYGIWQSFYSSSKDVYPEIGGRLNNFFWSEIEVSPNVWVWNNFDSLLTIITKDDLPVINMVYTKENAPDWLYTNGVPKVTEKDAAGNVTGYAPYYADDDYKFYFKRMITTVRQHIETLPTAVRNKIAAVQACLGNTGDYIGYKGIVPTQYELTGTDLYNLFTEFSKYYYDEYKNTSPKIYVLHNPSNDGEDEILWLLENCPGGWVKTGTLGKGFQLNDEKIKSAWLYDVLNNPQSGDYLRTRSEITGDATFSEFWKKNPYKNMFALMCYGVRWGLDMSNQSGGTLIDPKYDSAFRFFNKYNRSSSQKDPAKSTNAMCALKDGLDAADEVRFPAATYGTVDRTNILRYQNIVNKYSTFGAVLEDPLTATLMELDNFKATGINDVGWDLLPDNYDRYIHQITPNITSAGYWNIEATRDANAMYGRFGRGFDITKNKNALYFDVDSAFLNYLPLDGKYAVNIEITYLDDSDGSWQLFYDAKTDPNKASILVTGTKTNKWKKASVTLTDCYFGNRGNLVSDFSIRSDNNKKVVFSIVELSRSAEDISNIKLYASSPPSFDTSCINSTEPIKQFTLNGSSLDGSPVTVGPFAGYGFATSSSGLFSDSLVINNGSSFTKTIYIKLKTAATGAFIGRFPIKGGGTNALFLPIRGTIVNTKPVLSAIVTSIPCMNYANNSGAVDLTVSGGTAPFNYNWASSEAGFFSAVSQDITQVNPADYTVTVTSAGGCIAKATYTVTNATTNEPDKPAIITGADADIKGLCGTGINFVYAIDAVTNATSYTWKAPTGIIIVSTTANGRSVTLNARASFSSGSLTVSANNICGSSGLTIKKLSDSPDIPGSILGPTSVTKNKTGLVYTVSPIIPGISYTWTASSGAKITAGQNTPSIIVTSGTLDGKITVKASNNCGSSYANILNVNVTNNPSLQPNGAANSESMLISGSDDLTKPILSIMPNPAKDFALLVFSAASKYHCIVEIIDLTGRRLLHKETVATTGENRLNIDLHNFTSGLYIVSIINDQGVRRSVKLIKE